MIDIGSNSVRLVVYEGAVRAATPIFNEKVLCGLGRAVHSTGGSGTRRWSGRWRRCRASASISRIVGVKNLRAIATAAVREAQNGREFIAKGEKACGTRIEVLSGEKEAELAAHGIRMGFREADGFAGDLGGGSLELIDIYKDTLNQATTLPLGGLRLIDTTGDKLDKAQAVIDEQLGNIGWLAKGAGRPFYAVGGTWRALAKLHMDETKYPLRVMQGYAISTRDAILFCEKVRRTKKLSLLPALPKWRGRGARCCPTAHWCWSGCSSCWRRPRSSSPYSASAKGWCSVCSGARAAQGSTALLLRGLCAAALPFV